MSPHTDFAADRSLPNRLQLAGLAAAALALAWALAGCGVVVPGTAEGPSAMVAPQAPPPLRTEPFVPAPGPDYTWIDGHWNWIDGHYVWKSGHWAVRRPGYHWVPPGWALGTDGRWHQQDGHWER
jgi:hypothetical protein